MATETILVKNLGPIINTTDNEMSPALSPDGKVLYFSRYRQPYLRPFMSRLNDTGWTQPVELGGLEGTGNTFCFTFDTLGNFYFVRDTLIGIATVYYIWKGYPQNGSYTYSKLSDVVNRNDYQSQPAISPDGKDLVFASRIVGSKNIDLYISHLQDDGSWTEPHNLGKKINTPGFDGTPCFSHDGSMLFFSSNGNEIRRGTDIFVTHKINATDTGWSEPVRLPDPINSIKDDGYFSSTSKDDTFFLSSYRFDGHGRSDIWEVFIPPTMWKKILNVK